LGDSNVLGCRKVMMKQRVRNDVAKETQEPKSIESELKFPRRTKICSNFFNNFWSESTVALGKTPNLTLHSLVASFRVLASLTETCREL
jgi:hypothetical protein